MARDAPLREAARTATWGLALWGAMQALAAALQERAAPLALLQAAVAEWGTARLGVAWTEEERASTGARAVVDRVLVGVLLGAGFAALATGVAVSTGGATTVKGPAAPAVLGFGAAAAVLGAVRDELLLRGLVLRTLRGVLPDGAAIAACGAVAAAARWGIDGAAGVAMVAEALAAVALASVWIVDRGGWMACAAHSAWTWTLGSLLGGGLVDVRFTTERGSGAGALAALSIAAVGGAVARARFGSSRRAPGGVR